ASKGQATCAAAAKALAAPDPPAAPAAAPAPAAAAAAARGQASIPCTKEVSAYPPTSQAPAANRASVSKQLSQGRGKGQGHGHDKSPGLVLCQAKGQQEDQARQAGGEVEVEVEGEEGYDSDGVRCVMSSGPSPALRAVRSAWSALPLAERVQWSQGADSVEVWLLLPPGTAKHELSVGITATRLRVNLGWAGRVLDGPLTRSVKASEALWVLERDREADAGPGAGAGAVSIATAGCGGQREVVRLHILLPKAERHYWRSLFEGGAQKSHLEVLQEALAADEPHQAYDQLDPEAQALVDDLRERQWLVSQGHMDIKHGFDDFRLAVRTVVLGDTRPAVSSQFDVQHVSGSGRRLTQAANTANTVTYCNIPGGTTCQNCAGGNCTSADSRWLNPSLCQLPTSLGGTLNNVCSDPFLAPAFAPMLYRTSLTASVTDSQSGNETVAVVGSVTAMIVAGPSLVVTVQTSCPWMIWSSATNPATQTDSNALLAASYQTVYDGGTVDLVAPMKLQPSLAATPSYYTCMTFSVPLAVPAACPPFGQLYVRVTLNNVNRVFARQDAAQCVPDTNPLNSGSPTVQADTGTWVIMDFSPDGTAVSPPPSPPLPP
ncbi:hypothetical protein QJQ45_022828, partial [Haematococcus lacustris]